MNSSTSRPMADIAALVCALAVFAGFFMPWLTIPLFNMGVSGWSILILGIDAANNPNLHADTSGVVWLALVFVAALVAVVAALWGVIRPEQDRATAIWAALGGGVVLAIFIGAWLVMNAAASQSGTSQFNGSQLSGNGLSFAMNFIGFGAWVTLLGAIGLVAQVFFSRTVASMYQPRAAYGYGSTSGRGLNVSTGDTTAAVVVCRVCGSLQPAGLYLCRSCARPLEPPTAAPTTTISCPVCGVAQPTGKGSCHNCGRALALGGI